MKTTEYRAIEVEFFDEQPLRSTCLFCDWSFEGTASESREAALKHRAKKHPEHNTKHRRRHVRTLSSFRYGSLDDDSRAEIEEERRKRAFLNGIEIE